MQINNDITNTFGFFGHGGIGPAKHNSTEFVSSKLFSKVARILNKLSWITAYSEESNECHISYFYGKIVFREQDSTMTALLDQTYSNYGFNIEYDTPSVTTVNDIFNTTSNTFSIPIHSDLIVDTYPPVFKVEAYFNNTDLYKYRASFMGFCCEQEATIEIALFNCETGAQFTATEYALLNDYDLSLFLYGYRPVNTVVL